MDWILVLQIALLAILATLLVMIGYGSIVDKKREDDIHRKSGGL